MPSARRLRRPPSAAPPAAPPAASLFGASLFGAGALLGVVTAATAPALAQPGVTIREVVGARSRALGGAGVALADDTWRNPAALVAATRPSVRLYGDRAFLLPELQLAALSVALPMRAVSLGASAAAYGYQDFRTTSVTARAARGLRLGTARRIGVGMAVSAQHVALGGGYGSATGLSLDAGLHATLTPRLDAGARATNLLVGTVGDAPLPRRLDIGIAFAATPSLRVVADAGQVVGGGASVRGGVEMRVAPVLALRIGGGTNPEQMSGGLGLALGRLGIDLSFARTGDLGWTPAVEVRTHF